MRVRRSRHIGTQAPQPHRCPDAHCELVVHVQYPSVHCPVGPHCVFVEQVPHVPPTQAIPPPHWLFAVQAVQTPPMQARPESCPGPP